MTEYKTKCGSIVIFDDANIDLVAGYIWGLDKYGYAKRKGTANDRPWSETIYMHRAIAGAEPGQVVDHINRNPLDNRAQNLRFVDRYENAINRRKSAGKSSQFKGVVWSKCTGKWLARIKRKEDKHQKHLGSFDCEHEAAHVYNKAAVAAYGEFAVLNPVGTKEA